MQIAIINATAAFFHSLQNPADSLTPTSPYASGPLTPATAECSYAYVQFGSLQRPTSVPGTIAKASARQYERTSSGALAAASPYAATCSTFLSANMPLPPPKLLAAAQAGDKRLAGRSVSTAGKPPIPVAPRPPRRPESVSSMTASSIEALDAILPDDGGIPKFVLGDGDTLSVGSSGCNNNRRSPSTYAKPNPPARRSSIAQQNSTAPTPIKPHQQHSSSALSHSAAATPVTPVTSESAAAAARTSARLSALIVELQASPGTSEASKQAAVSSELKLALLSRMLKSSTPPAQQHQQQPPAQPQLMSSFARGGATPVPLPEIPCSVEWAFRDRLMRDIERGVQLRNQPPPQMRK